MVILKLTIDVAISDMVEFEKEALKILTVYINGGLDPSSHASSAYIDELRPKMPKARCTIRITFSRA